MKPTLILGVMGTVVMLALLFELLRRRHLRGKYAVLWIAVALCSLLLTLFPGILWRLADLTGVEVPSNLLFFMALLLLVLTSIQHSYEVGRLEEKTRILAEEIGLLNLELVRDSTPPAASESSESSHDS